MNPITQTTFCTPIDNASTTVAAPYAPGSGSLVVASVAPYGSPSPSNPVRLTVTRQSDGARTHLKATGISGNTITVSVMDGYVDLPLSIGDAVAVTPSAGAFADIHSAIGTITTAVNSLISTYAPIASPVLTGNPTAPTPSPSDSSTALATTAFVKGQGYLTSAPVSSVAGRTGAITLTTSDVSGLGTAASHASTDFSPAAGSTSITTLGTITAGSWQGSAIATAYLGGGTPGTGKYLDGAGTWTPLPSAPVSSVAGRTGAVTLTSADISGLGSIATHASSDFVAAGGQAASVATIAGLISAGSGVTIGGAGTTGSPYSISAAGGGGGSTSPGGASGEIQFNASGSFAGASGLYWDSVDGRLGVGTSTPGDLMTLVGTSTATVQASVTNAGNGVDADTRIVVNNDAGIQAGLFLGSSTRNPNASSCLVYAGKSLVFMTNNTVYTNGGSSISFIAGGSANAEAITIIGGTSGNAGLVGIGIASPAAQIHAQASTAGTICAIDEGASGQSADLRQFRSSTGSVLSQVDALGAWHPPQLADSSAQSGSLYYSTTAGKLAYKDPGGTVHSLY